LVNEKSELGTFNYWPKSSEKFTTEPYPDDLDDTACALSSLLQADKNSVTESDLAKITKILIKLESKEGGPYFTWVVPDIKKTKWADIDLAVNSNIGFFLSLIGIKLPNLELLAEKSIEQKNFSSPYYHSENALYFFISRFYKGQRLPELLKIIRENNLKAFKNPLECALLGISLLNLGENPRSIERNISYLCENQKKDGSFGCFSFVVEKIQGKKKLTSGSDAFTTSLAIELISRYLDKIQMKKKADDSDFKILQKKVLLNCQKIIKGKFCKDLSDQFDSLLEKIVAYDKNFEITLHPYLFKNSLRKIYPALEDTFLIDLACGSIFGWIAYTIYDNIIDEKKDLDKLPLANICNRELERLYCQDDFSFQKVFHSFMSEVDYANFYEIRYARMNTWKESLTIYKEPDLVAGKSIAHCLGPLAILYKLGCNDTDPTFTKIVNFYRSYLTARQIHDDAHDWEEDLLRGQINYAGELLLREFQKKYRRQAILPDDQSVLRRIFWGETILIICKTINDKISEARKNLGALNNFISDNYLSFKLSELEGAASKSLSEREKTINYLVNLY
jgi:hypothetical protein